MLQTSGSILTRQRSTTRSVPAPWKLSKHWSPPEPDWTWETPRTRATHSVGPSTLFARREALQCRTARSPNSFGLWRRGPDRPSIQNGEHAMKLPLILLGIFALGRSINAQTASKSPDPITITWTG